MARIGLIDVDGHNFPNLALMRISAFHKAQGDTVEWWFGFEHYDIVYMSKVFSDEYTPDVDEPTNAEKVIKGGSGYAITKRGSLEIYDKSLDIALLPEIERSRPDYSLYPNFNFAVAMTSRGCPRNCPFCHVAAKEGRACRKVADVADFYNGQPRIEILDPNLTACAQKRELFQQYKETGAALCFNQGLDIRLIDSYDISELNAMNVAELHFAWDNPAENLESKFAEFAKEYSRKQHGYSASVYVLCNFNSTMQENLHRIYTLRDLGFDPYVMIYDKPNAPRQIRLLQRWCNNKKIFRTVSRFEDYKFELG